MAEHTVYTLSEVAQHKSKKDCWLVIDGRVLNLTKFLEEHPGGEEVLLESAGKDATKEFKDIGHSKAAQNLLLKYQVGVLQGYTLKKDADIQVASTDEPKNMKEMSAFVIKDDSMPKYAALVEFFVPLLVAGSYLSYRYLTTGSSMV
ncbi:Cytochrome b5-like heme/steroid binding domain - like 10 [Theobroma cacao]|uniref:Cytochrome B5, n3,ATCB5-D,CB5-D n=1 Tax=Theobroma cacao TaxID=3641 RepID=A0A061FFU4_THECC|nr:Cytochrome B5, n3,ATCB5-D,CB5-D [Theobroma cacao]WRX30787.1 Cytochrome b5-like heme/steroid binding domain - like 10 [Theobroma cacao]